MEERKEDEASSASRRIDPLPKGVYRFSTDSKEGLGEVERKFLSGAKNAQLESNLEL